METSVIFEIISLIGDLIRSEENRICKELGLFYIHIKILLYLKKCNKYSNTPAAISEYFGITRGPISQNLIHMEKIGLVTKEKDNVDKRSVRIKLTDHGNDIVKYIEESSITKKANEIFKENVAFSEELFSQTLQAIQYGKNKPFGNCQTCKSFIKSIECIKCGITEEILEIEDTTKMCYHHNT